MLSRALLVLVVLHTAYSLDNGLALTPPLGYNTWNDYGCANLSEKAVLDAARGIIQSGLHKVGYEYVVVDDCWSIGRSANGTLLADPAKFPRGIAYVANAVHAMGLKFGIYTDRGTLTCQKRPGSAGHVQQDAQFFARAGVDYLKEDSCNAPANHKTALAEYGAMRDALNATGRPVLFSLCGWAAWYAAAPGSAYGNMWRIAKDVDSYKRFLNAINVDAALAADAGKGGWNDPDMLLGSDSTHVVYYLSKAASRTQFSLWCILSAPLVLGAHVAHLTPYDLETYSNGELIKVNQDARGLQGIRLVGGDLSVSRSGGLSMLKQNAAHSTTNVFGKQLSDDSWALIFINTASTTQHVHCNVTNNCTPRLASLYTQQVKVHDYWNNKFVAVFQSFTKFTATVPPNGASLAFHFTSI